MDKLLAILFRARALHGALSSETTRRQWWVTFPVAVLVAAAGYFLPPIAGEEVALALTTVLIAALAPLVSRAIGYQDKDLPYAEVFIIAVMRRRERVWRAFSGTLLDAHAEGYDWAQDADGNLYDVQSGQCEGVVMRDAVASIRELQGGGSTSNAPDLGLCADNTDREER